jgi:ribonuclease BN (tRNA processing enzyme)
MPAAGPAFVRTGGNTSCVAVARGADDPPTLLLDAGTGIAQVTRLLDGQPFRGSLLFGHLHWDHIFGLPFFSGGDRDDAEVDVYVPAQGRPALDLLSQAMSPPAFPITPRQLRGRWTFRSLDEGLHRIEGFDVLAREIPHKGGRTFGYRISDGVGSVAYLSDHAPHDLGAGPDGLGAHHEAVVELCRGVDVLVHDAQLTAAELPARRFIGHAAVEYAVGLAYAVGVPRLLLFHHDPTRTDDQVDELLAQVACDGVEVAVAREGDVVSVNTGPLAPPGAGELDGWARSLPPAPAPSRSRGGAPPA